MKARRWALQIVVGVGLGIAALSWSAIPAGAHELSGFSITCSSVSATVADTGTPDLNDHPMVWNVKVGSGSFVVVPSTETNVGGPGEDVVIVTGDISALTAGLAGQSATVEAFVSFPSGSLPSVTATVTCGTPPVTAPATGGGEGAQVSPAEATRAPVAAAPQAVQVGPRFTG